MTIFQRIVANDYIKIAISVGLCILAITIAVFIGYKSSPKIPNFKSNPEEIDLRTLKNQQYRSHHIFVVDVSKSFVQTPPSKRVLNRCKKTISNLVEEFIINEGGYPEPKSSVDVAKLYILEALLKLKKTSNNSNHYSIWTIGDNSKVILSDSFNLIDEKSIKNLVKNIIIKKDSIYPLNDNHWTDYTKLIDYLMKSYEKNNPEYVNVSIISDFNYSIKDLENDLDFKNQEIIDQLQKLSSIPIKVNKIELKNDRNGEGIYIGGEDYFEDIFGIYNTNHSNLELIKRDQPLVSDFIYTHQEIETKPLINIDKKKFSTISIPEGSYRLSVPINPITNISSVEVSVLSPTKKEKQKIGKLKNKKESLNCEIDQGDFIKLEFFGDVSEDVEQIVRLVNSKSGNAYSISHEFKSIVPQYIFIVIVFLFLVFILLICAGFTQIKNQIKKEANLRKETKTSSWQNQ